MSARVSVWLLTSLLAVACRGDLGEPGVPVASLHVSVPSTTLTVGSTLQATAQPLDAAGRPLPGRSVAWSSDRPDRAPVSTGGLVTALAPGLVRVIATSEARSAWVELEILAAPVPVVAVRVAGERVVDMLEGEAVELVAQVLGPADTVLEDRPVTWRSLAPAVASVSSSGLVVAVGEGSSRIIASVNQHSDTVLVQVHRVPVSRITLGHGGVVTLLTGDRYQLIVQAQDASGAELPGRTIQWSVEDPAIANVSASGVVTALAVGSTDAIATVEGLTARVALDIRSRIEKVLVIPATVVMGTGESAALSVQLLDARGFGLTRTVAWTSERPDVVTVDDEGRLVAVGPGSTRVRAWAEGQEGWASVVVLDWVDRPLTAIGDSSLPATVRLRTIEAPGAPPRSERVLAVAGALRVVVTGSMVGRYQLQVSIWILREGEALQAGTLGFSGSMTYHAAQGVLHLAVPTGPGLTATPLPDGAWLVTGPLWTGDEERVLRFGKPAGW